jgi:hypothetical protein
MRFKDFLETFGDPKDMGGNALFKAVASEVIPSAPRKSPTNVNPARPCGPGRLSTKPNRPSKRFVIAPH